jgi:hypothetical protein
MTVGKRVAGAVAVASDASSPPIDEVNVEVAAYRFCDSVLLRRWLWGEWAGTSRSQQCCGRRSGCCTGAIRRVADRCGRRNVQRYLLRECAAFVMVGLAAAEPSRPVKHRADPKAGRHQV